MRADQILPESEKAKSARKIILRDLGFSENYNQVWQLQKSIVEQRNLKLAFDTLMVVEHAHVLTIGRNGHNENILMNDLPVFEIERGGDVTYHGPGQLVVYPIISLQDHSLGIRQYVERLEQVLVDTLTQFGISSEGRLGKETGIWIGGSRKIASIGIATSHWTTYHGFALNVNTDLSYFEKIRPCGLESSVMTSMSKELMRPVELQAVKRVVLSRFAETFDLDFVDDARYHKNLKR